MFKFSWIEFILRSIPEGFLFIFAAYAFTKSAVNPKKYIMSSVIYGILAYAIRFLPIQYGVHSILNIIVIIAIMIFVNKVDTIKAIQAAIIVMILGFVSEGINVFIIQTILKKNLEVIFNNVTLKTLYGVPSLIIYGIIVALYYFRLLKRKELRYISDGKNN